MTGMVERYARAMWETNRERCKPHVELDSWEDETQALRDDWMAMARDGIEAMREPTPEMVEAGDAVEIEADERGNKCPGLIGEPVWRAMIAAALSPQV